MFLRSPLSGLPEGGDLFLDHIEAFGIRTGDTFGIRTGDTSKLPSPIEHSDYQIRLVYL